VGEGEDKPGGKPGEKPEESGFQAPKPGGSIGKEKKFGEKEQKFGNEKPKPGEAGEGEGKSKGPDKKLSVGPFYKTEGEATYKTTKKSEEDKTYASLLTGKYEVELGAASLDLEKKKASVTVVEGTLEGSIVHGEVDLVDQIKHLLFGDDATPATPPTPTAPMAARVGDLTMHLGPLAPGPGSPNVLIGRKPAWRVGLDVHLCPAPGAPHGGGPTQPGATTVLINGAPAARATDFVVEPTGGPDVIAIGFPTVLIGIPTPPPPAAPKAPEDLPWVKFESVGKGDVGTGDLKGAIKGDVDLTKGSGKVELEGEAFVAALKGELPLKVRIRIPFTSYYLGLGVKVEGSLLSAGVSGNLRGAINENGKVWDASAGAKIGAGIGGVGIKGTMDIAK